MYRQYEDPREIESAIHEQEKACKRCPNDPEEFMYLQELKDRLAQAWQDDEYNSEDTY